jgi:hypothetical protein
MKRNIILIVLIFSIGLLSKVCNAQLPNIVLTDSARVSLLTCSQGEELYSIFGHSAIRVADPNLGVDWVFNYGTFDFSDPNFYPNFVRGKLNYILSVAHFKNFEISYAYEERFIYEQVLNIQLAERQKLLDSLIINYLPQNRYYLYDFLFDNCATRIRDIFLEAVPRVVEFDNSTIQKGKSFRELLAPNVKEKPWAELGINLLLGVNADRIAQPWDYMFLPDHMMIAFENAYFNEDGRQTPFAKKTVTILKGKQLPTFSFRNAPLFTFTVFLIISALIVYLNVKKQRFFWWFDRTLFGLTGLLGCILAFQWFGSDHAVMALNYNLIWANPLHIIAAFFITSNRFAAIAKYYFGANAIIMFLLLIFWFIIPQTLPFPMFPLVAAIGIRSLVIYKPKLRITNA